MFKRLLEDKRGNTMPEVAVAIIILSAVFMTGTYMITAVRHNLVMEMAAKEGARALAVSNSITTGEQMAKNELKIGNVSANVTIDKSLNKVTVSKHYGFYVPLLDTYMFNLNASAAAHKEENKLYYDK